VEEDRRNAGRVRGGDGAAELRASLPMNAGAGQGRDQPLGKATRREAGARGETRLALGQRADGHGS
jgi:hypothetical protein